MSDDSPARIGVRAPGDLPLPVRVVDDQLGLVTTLVSGESAEVEPGLYAVTTALPDGTTFRRAVRLDPGAFETISIALEAKDARRTRSPQPWWLDYVAIAEPHVQVGRPGARRTGTDVPVPDYSRTFVRFDREPAEGFIMFQRATRVATPSFIRLPPIDGLLEVMSGPRRVEARGVVGGGAAVEAASRLADRGQVSAAVELLSRLDEQERPPIAECLLGFLRLRVADGRRVAIERLLKEASDLPDVWVLAGVYRAADGRHDDALSRFLIGLAHGVPTLSDAVSWLMSGLRDGVPENSDHPGRPLNRRLGGLAQLAATAKLDRVVFTVEVPEERLLKCLSTVAGADAQLVTPRATRERMRYREVLGIMRGESVPWRPGGRAGDAVVGAARVPDAVGRKLDAGRRWARRALGLPRLERQQPPEA